jgi:hypothetical protein
LGGAFNSPPAVISTHSNNLEICALGTDNQVYLKEWSGSNWSNWIAKGGTFNSAPAVASWGSYRLDICGIGLDNQMYHKAWDGQGSWIPSGQGWEPLGGQFRAFHSNLL